MRVWDLLLWIFNMVYNVPYSIFSVGQIIWFSFQKLKSATVSFHEPELMRTTKKENLCFEMCNFVLNNAELSVFKSQSRWLPRLSVLIESNMSESDKSSTWTIYINRKHNLLSCVCLFYLIFLCFLLSYTLKLNLSFYKYSFITSSSHSI